MRRFSISVLAWFLAAGIAAADEFCVVANGGRVCGYFNYYSCLDAASRQNGACIVQASPAPSFQSAPYPPPPPRLSPPNPGAYDWGRSIMDGYEAGVRDRQAREARSVPAPARQRAHPAPPPSHSGETWAGAMTAAFNACGAILRRGLEFEQYVQAQPYIDAYRICRSTVDQEYGRWRPAN